MLWTIFVVLLILWLLGMVSSYTLGGFIHILLVLAVITLIFNLVSGRRSAVWCFTIRTFPDRATELKGQKSMSKFLKLLLGTGLYLLEQSDQSTRKIRDRAAENLNDLRDLAQDKYETATDRVSKASRALRGDDGQFVSNALSMAAGVGVGLAIGLIFAPASGEETRSALVDKVQTFGDRVKQQFSSGNLDATGTHG
jgi:ElaB/YqjD/DUF883 family membrane-anchored ribosome-binding protein